MSHDEPHAEPREPLAHADDPRWNESMYAYWYDRDVGVAGWHRIAHRPNLGTTSTFTCIAREDGVRYYRMRTGPHEDAHRRGGGWSGADLSFRWEGEALELRYGADDGCEAELDFTGFHAPADYRDVLASYGRDLSEIAAEHVEQAGAVTGSVRLGDAVHEVSALGYRDHSWGHRNLHAMLCSRWLVGTCGPALSFSGAALMLEDKVIRTGYVIRDAELTAVSSFDVTLTVELDGFSHRAATGTFELLDGTTVSVELADVLPGGILRVDEWVGLESAATARVDGLTGVGNCETSNNLLRGTADPPYLVSGAAVREGLSTPAATLPG